MVGMMLIAIVVVIVRRNFDFEGEHVSLPINQRGLVSMMILSWALMALIAGYSSASLQRIFGKTGWIKNALHVGFALPCIFLTTFFCLNELIRAEHSSGAISHLAMLVLNSPGDGNLCSIGWRGKLCGLQRFSDGRFIVD